MAPTDGSLKEFTVLDPCGMCRELLTDYAPQLEVIIAVGSSVGKVAVSDLIPGKESRRRRGSRRAF